MSAAKPHARSSNEEWIIPPLLSELITASGSEVEENASFEDTQPFIHLLSPADQRPAGDELGYHEVLRHAVSGERCELFLVIDQVSGLRRIARIARRATLERDARFADDMKTSADLLRDLHSSHLVKVIANGMTNEAEPRPYVITERLAGRNLAVYLRRHGALDPSLTIEIGVQVAKAVSVLHRTGLTNPELHPGALMLTHLAGDHFAIKLTGLDRVREMSPRQVDGSSPEVRADLRRFGALLQHLLLGHPEGIQTDASSSLAGPVIDVDPALAGLLHRLGSPDPHIQTDSIDTVLADLRSIQASIAEASCVSMLRRRIQTVAPMRTRQQRQATHSTSENRPQLSFGDLSLLMPILRPHSQISLNAIPSGLLWVAGVLLLCLASLLALRASATPMTPARTTVETANTSAKAYPLDLKEQGLSRRARAPTVSSMTVTLPPVSVPPRRATPRRSS